MIFVETPLVNWVVLAGDGTITLIDAGYPKHLDAVTNVLVAVPDPQAIEPGRLHRFSGHAVVPLASPGHTPGHLAYWLPAARVLACGDAIATGHPTSRTHGVQLPARYFNTDDELAHTTMEMLLREPVEVLLPGHGPRVALARHSGSRDD